jgi:phosphopantetheine adenylyltransferase
MEAEKMVGTILEKIEIFEEDLSRLKRFIEKTKLKKEQQVSILSNYFEDTISKDFESLKVEIETYLHYRQLKIRFEE